MPFPRTLAARLAAVPHRFDGLHAIRLTELGLASEPTRLQASQGLAFAPSPVAAVADQAGRRHLRIAFLGLTGPLGVLPQPYSELVHKADRLRNRAVSAFLDMFNHRLASLFVRAGEKYRLGLLLQRAATEAPVRQAAAVPERDPASRAMLALAGFGTPLLRGRMAVEDEVVLFYAGLFAARLRPPGALQAMLADYLGVAVRIEPFSGRWVPVAPGEQSRLPRAGEPVRFATLGVDAVAGARIWDVQGNFRVVVGPVDSAAMHALMPDRLRLRKLVDLVRAYAGMDLGFDVQVVLRADCVPELEMTGDPDQAGAPRLGWNTWAKSLPALADKDDIILDPDLVLAQRPRAEARALDNRAEARASDTRAEARASDTRAEARALDTRAEARASDTRAEARPADVPQDRVLHEGSDVRSSGDAAEPQGQGETTQARNSDDISMLERT